VVLSADKGAVYASAAGPGAQPALPTAVPTSATGSPTPTGIIPTRESTRLPTAVPTTGLPTVLPTAQATECANRFVDIDGNVFYGAIHFLSCGGIASGTDQTHYSPVATASRAQFAKIVVLGFLVPPIEPSSQTFTDVPSSYFAHRYIESGYVAGILSGFTEAQCQAANASFPCYLPNRSITRAELTRLVVNAAHYPLINPPTPSFDDVPLTNFAYAYIETAYRKGVVHGTDATHFEPGRNIRRDEMAQIIYAGMTTP
jgi:S-layer homology domain